MKPRVAPLGIALEHSAIDIRPPRLGSPWVGRVGRIRERKSISVPEWKFRSAFGSIEMKRGGIREVGGLWEEEWVYGENGRGIRGGIRREGMYHLHPSNSRPVACVSVQVRRNCVNRI